MRINTDVIGCRGAEQQDHVHQEKSRWTQECREFQNRYLLPLRRFEPLPMKFPEGPKKLDKDLMYRNLIVTNNILLFKRPYDL